MQRALESHPHSPPSITVCDINAEMLKVGQQRAQDVFKDPKCVVVSSAVGMVECVGGGRAYEDGREERAFGMSPFFCAVLFTPLHHIALTTTGSAGR